jgi:hypothetical protein
MMWPCDGSQTHVSRVVSFGGCNVLVVTTFRTGLLLFSFAFHSYYKDLVSMAAFTFSVILNLENFKRVFSEQISNRFIEVAYQIYAPDNVKL